MEEFTITYSSHKTALKWLRYLSIGFGGMLLLSFALDYRDGQINWLSYFILASGFVELFLGIFILRTSFFGYPEFTLSDDGIKYGKENRIRKIEWSHILNISVDTHSIILSLDNNKMKKISVAPLNNKEFHAVEEQLQKFAAAKKVKFQSLS